MSRAETPDGRPDPLARTQPLDFDAGREEGCQGHKRAVDGGTDTLIRTVDERGHFRVLMPDGEEAHDCLLVRVPGEEHHGWCDCKGFTFGDHPCAHLYAVRMAEVMNDVEVRTVNRSAVEADLGTGGAPVTDGLDEVDTDLDLQEPDPDTEPKPEPEFDPKPEPEADADPEEDSEADAQAETEAETVSVVKAAPSGPGYAIIRDVGRVDSEAFQINGNGWLVANPGDDSETWFPPHRVVKVRPYGGGPGE